MPVEPTATNEPTLEPTATTEPTVEPTSEPTATTEPTVEPTATTEPTLELTATLEPTLEPIATLEPTLEPTATLEATDTPTIAPIDVTDTTRTGTAWYAADGVDETAWYMTVPPTVVADAPVQDTAPTVVDPAGVDGILGTEDDPAGPDGALGTADDLPVAPVAPVDPVDIAPVPTATPEPLALELDLGSIQTVGAVRWQWTETTYAHGAVIETSLDGETWTPVAYPDTWNELPGEWYEAAVGIDARYVRFTFPDDQQLGVVGGLTDVEIVPILYP